MLSERNAGKKIQETDPDITIHVVGKNAFQNDLIGSFFEENLQAACSWGDELPRPGDFPREDEVRHLVLVDCQGREDVNPWAEYEIEALLGSGTCHLAFYNVHPEAGIEAMALKAGVRGVLYSHESVNTFPKAVNAILQGEFWFSRKVLTALLRSATADVDFKADSYERLTAREKEILMKIAGGATNQEISEAFFISTHTVKSHIYSIYKKIKVKDRLQATLWAVKHL